MTTRLTIQSHEAILVELFITNTTKETAVVIRLRKGSYFNTIVSTKALATTNTPIIRNSVSITVVTERLSLPLKILVQDVCIATVAL
jgi:hypothetical protein